VQLIVYEKLKQNTGDRRVKTLNSCKIPQCRLQTAENLRCAEAEVVDHLYTQENCETLTKTLRDEKSATHTAAIKMK
jgi:hypothetical protein